MFVGQVAYQAVQKLGQELGSTVGIAADFEEQIVILGKAVGDTSVTIDELHDVALMLGSDTKLVGVTASTAAASMTDFYKAGLTTSDIFGDLNGYLEGTVELGGALRASIDLAAASELDMEGASKAVSIAMSTFGLKAEDASTITDSFVQAADASVSSVSDLTEALANVGPTAASFGWTLGETNTALAILSTRGISGAEAGTSLKSMMTNLMRPTADVLGALRTLNIELYATDGTLKPLPILVGELSDALTVGAPVITGYKDIEGEVVPTTEALTEEMRLQTIQILAGTYGMKAMNTLLTEGEPGWSAMTVAIGEATTAQEIAEARTKTFAGRMETFQGTVESLKIGIGEVVLGPLTDLAKAFGEFIQTHTPDIIGGFVTLKTSIGEVVQALEPFVAAVIAFVTEHAEPLKNALIAIGVVLAGAAVVGGILALVAAITALANPVTAVIVAVGLLAAAWTEDWGGIRTTLTEWWENTGKRIFAEIEKVVGELVTWFEEHLPAMIETVTKVMADIKVIWDAAWPPIERALKATWETMKSSVETIITLISGVISTVMAIIDGDWTTAWNQIKQTAVDVFEGIKETLKKALNIILALFKTNLNDIGDKVETGFSGIASSVEGWMTTTSTTVSSKFAEIKESLGTWLGGMQSKAAEAAGGILEALQGPYAAAKAAIADPGGTLDGIIKALPGLLTSAQTTIQGFGSGILNSLADPYRQAVEFLFGAEGLLPGLPGKITEEISKLVTAITDRAEGIKTAIMQPFKDSSGGLFGEDGIFVNINKAMGAALLDLLVTVTGKAGDFYDAAVGWAGSIKDGFIGAIEGRIAGGVSLATEFAGAVKGMINHLIDAINQSLNDIYVGTVLGKRLAFNAPDIPHLAGGVIGFGGGLAVVGENGPEVVQLPRGANVYTTNNYNINANYAHQGERSLRSDIRFLQLVGAV